MLRLIPKERSLNLCLASYGQAMSLNLKLERDSASFQTFGMHPRKHMPVLLPSAATVYRNAEVGTSTTSGAVRPKAGPVRWDQVVTSLAAGLADREKRSDKGKCGKGQRSKGESRSRTSAKPLILMEGPRLDTFWLHQCDEYIDTYLAPRRDFFIDPPPKLPLESMYGCEEQQTTDGLISCESVPGHLFLLRHSMGEKAVKLLEESLRQVLTIPDHLAFYVACVSSVVAHEAYDVCLEKETLCELMNERCLFLEQPENPTWLESISLYRMLLLRARANCHVSNATVALLSLLRDTADAFDSMLVEPSEGPPVRLPQLMPALAEYEEAVHAHSAIKHTCDEKEAHFWSSYAAKPGFFRRSTKSNPSQATLRKRQNDLSRHRRHTDLLTDEVRHEICALLQSPDPFSEVAIPQTHGQRLQRWIGTEAYRTADGVNSLKERQKRRTIGDVILNGPDLYMLTAPDLRSVPLDIATESLAEQAIRCGLRRIEAQLKTLLVRTGELSIRSLDPVGGGYEGDGYVGNHLGDDDSSVGRFCRDPKTEMGSKGIFNEDSVAEYKSKDGNGNKEHARPHGRKNIGRNEDETAV
ncbi:MAG: uncharacterized protein KVP18_004095 [Porospora cf. gigantea A]|uniref:uncharacterized protein n=1 Tax=Porospora cf. gigantea A TaxID=2853593 RepID=UPI00355A477E|nr:MAG: hypothetical protein KVP18_004095 [Porospora cf. gigantea A]